MTENKTIKNLNKEELAKIKHSLVLIQEVLREEISYTKSDGKDYRPRWESYNEDEKNQIKIKIIKNILESDSKVYYNQEWLNNKEKDVWWI